jgi:hypothetical protein
MRILLTHHFPLDESHAGRLARAWAAALTGAGHEARLLVVDANRAPHETATIEVVACRESDAQADLSFDVPRFNSAEGPAARLTFDALSDQQLAIYRDIMRRRLDTLVDAFDPHVIHAQHVWVQGQLALETGVPYLLNAWGPELADYGADERYRRLADQAAANAGRILAASPDVQRRVVETFEIEPERVVLMDEALRVSEPRAAAGALAAIYQSVLDERSGGRS